VEIVLKSVHASVSPAMRRTAERIITRAAARLPRAVDAIVRFEQDGTVRRVEVVLHAPRQAAMVATGEGRYFGPALSQALARLTVQMTRERNAPKSRARRANKREAARD
jgi:ribosome-associated translation inhibitor RaiA